MSKSRLLAGTALLLATFAIAAVLLRGGAAKYSLHLHFLNAGGLVKGGKVEVAGRKVGQIKRIALTSGGQADVIVSIDDERIVPLHQGTRAQIRAVGQAGITNNFVRLVPGPRGARRLPTGSVLDTLQTSGIVSIDALLDAFGPKRRRELVELITRSDEVFAGSGSRYFNRTLGKLNPALVALNGASGEIADDRTALAQLVRTAATAATAVDSRRADVDGAVVNTARALRVIADQRAELAGVLQRSPAVLRQARGTLARADQAVTALRPALRDVVPVADPLRHYLVNLRGALPAAGDTAAELASQLSPLNRGLNGLPAVRRPALPALRELRSAMTGLEPIVKGLRFYGSDLVLGVLSGVFGIAAGEYSYGHFQKANFVQNPQTVIAGPLSAALAANPLVPGLFNGRVHLERRCPGGNQPPSPDGSSPWDLGPELCTAGDDVQADVNTP